MSEHEVPEQITVSSVTNVLLKCFFSQYLFKEWISSCFVEFGSCCSYLPHQWCLEKKSELQY